MMGHFAKYYRRPVLDVGSSWTQVGRVSTRKMLTAQNSGRQLESAEDGEVGGVQIGGNVEDITEDEETSNNFAHQRDGVTKIREDRRNGFSIKSWRTARRVD